MNIAYLDLTWWGVSAGGEHYYATLSFKKHGKTHRLNLKQPMTQKMATYLNKKEQTSIACRYHKGDITQKFNNPQEAIKTAIKTCESFFPQVDVILSGSGAMISVSEALWAKNKTLMKQINDLHKKAEKINFYSGIDDELMEKIDEKFDKLIGRKK